MECLLCEMWARMPYAKKWSTPTTPEETQGALIIGYWLASRTKVVPRICEGHMAVLNLLDQQEEQRIAAEIAKEQAAQKQPVIQPTPQLLAVHQQLIAQGRQDIIDRANKRAERIAKQAPPVKPIAAAIPVLHNITTEQPVIEPPSEFKLGPGPLTNENSTTSQPPLPVVIDPSAPYRNIQAEITTETASEPETEGAKLIHACPLCGKEIAGGEVHAC